jgi:NADP-dependent 3-hydroxy acid dehydrogenase YdfG
MTVIVITGTSSGIGSEVALGLASKPGIQLVTLNHTKESATLSSEILLSKVPDLSLESRVLDLTDFEAVVREGRKIQKTYQKIDFIILNSGVMLTPFKLNKDKMEGR